MSRPTGRLKRRKTFLFAACCWLLLPMVRDAAFGGEQRRAPNVILVMTDDQGYGDLGVHGNPIIKTPNLDEFARQSVEVNSFYVCPVCAPTRATLMTGRYNYRTGVTDTYLGRAMMHADEVTLAEMLRDAGYRTGIFGKWHLGDSFPMRPMDQGFEESLVHTGGGLCQPAGPYDNSYFDPSLLHNGRRTKTKGYCSDVYVDGLLEFITEHRAEPFFVYLPFNCPHSPYQVAQEYSKPYDDLKMKPDDFPSMGHKRPSVPKNTAAVFGMVQNIDENVGRILDRLDELKLADDTIVIFLTDNGPNGARYDAGMKAHKGSVYEGGIRTAFFVRWPGVLEPGRKVEQIAAHLDVVPTLLEACGATRPEGVKFDGRSMLPLLKGESTEWPERTLFFQWHRGDEPIMYRAFAARSLTHKLVHAGKVEPGTDPADVPFELYDMRTDPLEMKNIAAERPEIVKSLRRQYEAWLADVGRDHGYEAPRILVGTPHERRTVLTRQDWRGPKASWTPKGLGYWEIAVPDGGEFEITCDFDPPKGRAVVNLKLQGIQLTQDLKPGQPVASAKPQPYPLPPDGVRITFGPVALKASPAERLQAWIDEQRVKTPYGVRFVYVKRVDQ